MHVDEPAIQNIPSENTNSLATLIKSRIDMYSTAISNAKILNDNSRVRRFERGLKTLNGMLKDVNFGKTINVNDVLPEIVVKLLEVDSLNDNAVLAPTRPAPMPPTLASNESSSIPEVIMPTTQPDVHLTTEIEKNNSEDTIKLLLDRQREYKVAALDAKRSNDLVKAKNFVKIIKLFDDVIKAAQAGQEVDLSDMPPPPHELRPEMLAADKPNIENIPKKEDSENQNSTEKISNDLSPSQPVSQMSMLEYLIEKDKIYIKKVNNQLKRKITIVKLVDLEEL